MGWDGAGGYTRNFSFSADASSGIKILASRMDAELDDFASAMTVAWARNGQNVPTQDVPMGGQKFINVAAATSVNNYMRVREFIENVPIFMTDQESSADRISVSAQYFTSVSANQAPGDGTRILVRAGSDKASAVMYLNGHSANVEFQDGNAAVGAMVSGGIYEMIFASADAVWKVTNPTDGRTAAERAEGVTPTNYQYPAGHFFRYGVAGDGVTDDTTAIQKCLAANKGRRVFIPRGTYITSSSLEVYNQVIEGDSKEYVVFRPNGNFECFVNTDTEFIVGGLRNVTIIYNNGVQPTSSTGNDRKIGIYWSTNNGKSPNFFNIEDVEVRGAWWAYYDESGSYGCTFHRFFGWNCQNLFYKEGGTTFLMNHIVGLNVNKGIQLNTTLGFVLNACGVDGAVITDGDSLNEFVSCIGLAINGWDSESNDISGNGGCLFKFTDCTGTFNASVGHLCDFAAGAGEFVAVALFNDSYMAVSGHRIQFDTTTDELTMTGDGTFYHVAAESGAQITVLGGEFPQPDIVSGSPTLTPFIATGTARVQVIGATYEGTLGANTFEIKNDYTENTGTLTGCTTSPTGTIRATRSDMQVTIHVPQITGTSNTTAATITGGIPSGFRPARTQNCVAPITDNSATVMALALIGTDGTITLTSTPAGSTTFTGSGTKGIELCTLTYALD